MVTRRGVPGFTATALCAAAALLGAPAAEAQPPGPCFGDLDEDSVDQRPGPRLRFGITPRVQAGQVGGTPAPAVPEQPEKTHAALAELKARGGPFVIRLNRFFWSEREAGIEEFLALAERYTSRGYLVELQLRYHPDAEQEGDIPAWTEFVREVVRRFGPNRRVVALQVTNEVNVTFSADSSDGAYEGAREALVKGVIAASDEVEKHGFDQLEIGFNWFYRTDPGSEQDFWEDLRDLGGAEFAGAVDWIGLDIYPGTFFPPTVTPDNGERGAMVNGMSTLRCFAAIPGIGASVPMHIEENGWPTPPGRTYARQAEILENMVRATHDFRGTYNVTDYRWFNLRDADTSSPALAQHYGLMEDDYDPKPAFGVYGRLVEQLGARSAESEGQDGGTRGGDRGSRGSASEGRDAREEPHATNAALDSGGPPAERESASGRAGSGELPFSGLPLVPLAVLGALLLTAGAVLASRVHRSRSAGR